MLAGVYSFDPEWEPASLAKELAQSAQRFGNWEATNLWENKLFSCFSVQNNKEGIKVHHFSSENYEIFMYGVLLNPLVTAQELCRKISSRDEKFTDILEGIWVAVIYERKTASLFFVTDPFGGMWLYIGIFQNGILFCNDFGALASNFPGSLQIDWDSVLITFALNYVPTNSTIFKEIKILPPSQVVEVINGQLKTVLKFEKSSFGKKYFSLSKEEKFEILDFVWENSYQNWCAPSARPIVPLSSGYDSRYILAELSQGKRRIQCMTFGHPRSQDVVGAKSLCETQGIAWGHYYPQKIDWNSWTRGVEKLGVTGGFQYIAGWGEAWLNILKQQGDFVFLGFLGDALSGKHLVPRGDSRNQDWKSNWEAWSTHGGWLSDNTSSLFRAEIKEKMRSALQKSWEEAVGNSAGVSPHHIAMHLDITGRQRRFVAAQVNFVGLFSIPSCPFLTNAHFDFWFNVPYEDLQDQNLFKAYANSRFPQLFQVGKTPTIWQRIVGCGKNMLGSIVPSAKDFLLPSELNVGNMMISQRQEIIKLVEEVAPLLDSIFRIPSLMEEIEKFPYAQLNAIQLSRLVNMSILLRLSTRLHKTS